MIPFRNSSREYLADFARSASQSIPAGSLILDAGSKDSPYRSLFSQHRYECADFADIPGLTYKCDLADMPIEDNRFDLIFCSQVLEHVPRPLVVLRELRRVLKPGGRLWLSTPLFYAEHGQPHDFFRYTRFGLRCLFLDAGFVVEQISELEGYYGAISYQFDVLASHLPLRPSSYGGGSMGLLATLVALVLIPAGSVLSRFYANLDRRIKRPYPLCKNYCAVALKP